MHLCWGQAALRVLQNLKQILLNVLKHKVLQSHKVRGDAEVDVPRELGPQRRDEASTQPLPAFAFCEKPPTA